MFAFAKAGAKKYLLGFSIGASALFSPFAVSAAGCSFRSSASPDMRAIVAENGGFPIGDDMCAKLNKNNLRLDFSGMATVLDGVSVGWASVTISDLRTGLTSSEHSMNTAVNARVASMDKAKSLTYEALGSAVRTFDLNKAMAALKTEIAARKR